MPPTSSREFPTPCIPPACAGGHSAQGTPALCQVLLQGLRLVRLILYLLQPLRQAGHPPLHLKPMPLFPTSDHLCLHLCPFAPSSLFKLS